MLSMTINGFLWDEENKQHLAWHKVAPSEAEEVLENECFVTKEVTPQASVEETV